ncbi:hypothetical protein SAMN05443668_105327 [Cryptosporangium aurantiacum]|uniref:Uncharacterized protein n=1 Tax=Cryptosporangium aurantiacum TaxID=134849 RepID=A0A1M7QTM1_9ACTN|nr:hypothetical protein SAMN05443668_105327 [Cryptosporangium aurantiacum]
MMHSLAHYGAPLAASGRDRDRPVAPDPRDLLDVPLSSLLANEMDLSQRANASRAGYLPDPSDDIGLARRAVVVGQLSDDDPAEPLSRLTVDAVLIADAVPVFLSVITDPGVGDHRDAVVQWSLG